MTAIGGLRSRIQHVSIKRVFVETESNLLADNRHVIEETIVLGFFGVRRPLFVRTQQSGNAERVANAGRTLALEIVAAARRRGVARCRLNFLDRTEYRRERSAENCLTVDLNRRRIRSATRNDKDAAVIEHDAKIAAARLNRRDLGAARQYDNAARVRLDLRNRSCACRLRQG